MNKIFLVSLLLLSACTPSNSEGGNDAVVLKVGDQFGVLKSTLQSAGQDRPTGYEIEWSNFPSGPTIIAAETGGSVDIGHMMETPLVFAQAAGSPVKVVAVARRARAGTSALAVVVARESTITKIGDLKGKQVGFTPGTAAHYLITRLLGQEGLSLDDIRPVNIANSGPALLANGTVDATVTGDPLLSQMLAARHARIIATGGEPLTPDFNYLVASEKALKDDKRAAAIGDFAVRVARATAWQCDHVAEAAPIMAKTYNISIPIADAMLRRAPGRYVPISSEVIAAHQKEADAFHHLGLISRKIDARALFDQRYNALIAAADGRK